jgi:hypothetical protein
MLVSCAGTGTRFSFANGISSKICERDATESVNHPNELECNLFQVIAVHLRMNARAHSVVSMILAPPPRMRVTVSGDALRCAYDNKSDDVRMVDVLENISRPRCDKSILYRYVRTTAQ